MLCETLKSAKLTPHELENGGQNGSKIALCGYWPKASWICYLLHLGHIGRSREAPESHPKSSSIPEPLPNPIFAHFGRIWRAMWVPIWLHFRSFSGPIFAPIFERIFGWVRGGPGTPGSTDPKPYWGGDSFQEIPLADLLEVLASNADGRRSLTRRISRSRSNLGSMLLVARPRRPKGVLAGPGTPRDPKSHLFVTKWVAVAPFGTLKPGSGSEFRPGSRRGGPGAQIPTFFSPILDPKMPKSRFSGRVSNLSATHSNGFGAPGAQGGPRGPRGPQGAPWGPQGAPWAPQGAQGGPRGPLALGAPMGPLGPPWAPWAPLGPWAPKSIATGRG